MTIPLFPHQQVGAMRIAEGVPTYLAMDMGIGKSRCFIEAVRLRGAKRVLVLCPATALLVWKREIALWHPEATVVTIRSPIHLTGAATYYLVSHGLMSQKAGPIPEALVKGKAFDMTAIDEAHAFNAADTNRVKVLRQAALAFKLGNIIPLSGTPMKNHAGDLYTLLDLCWPQGFKMTRNAYEEQFCKITHKTFGGSRMIRVIEGSKNLDVLRKLIAPFMMRVKKEDVFKDLPAILWDSVPVPLDSSVLLESDFKEVEGHLTKALATKNGFATVLEAIRQMAGTANVMTMRRLLGLAKLRGATEYIVDMLDNLPERRKVLIFAHHSHVIAALARHLGEYSPAVLVGTTNQKDREIAVDKFLTDDRCRVFIGNILAAGTAVTLVGPKCKCSDVVFVESSWTPMDNAQAACRVHRIGQQDGVVARMLSASGTIDDLINNLLARKAREFTQLFDTNNKETT